MCAVSVSERSSHVLYKCVLCQYVQALCCQLLQAIGCSPFKALAQQTGDKVAYDDNRLGKQHMR